MNRPQRTRMLIGIILILAVVSVYIPQLTRPLEYDEDYTLRWYAHSLSMALIGYTRPNNHFLHSFLVWGSASLIGDSPIIIRFPSFLAGLLALAAMYRMVIQRTHLLGGIIAFSLLAGSAAMLHYGVTARGYTLTLLETLWLLYLLSQSHPTRWSLTLISYAMIITLPTMWLALVGGAIWRIWEHHDWKASIPLFSGAMIGCLHYLPAFLAGQAGLFAAQFGQATLIALINDILKNTWTDSILLTGIILVGTLAAVILRSDMRRLTITMFGAALVLTISGKALMDTYFYGRNYSYLLIPLFIASGAGWSRLAELIIWRIKDKSPGYAEAFSGGSRPVRRSRR